MNGSIYHLARAEALRKFPETENLDELIADILADWRAEDAREQYCSEDSPSIDSCDDYGTGEGRFHGRM